MVMPLKKRENPGSWQVKKEQIVIFIICSFVLTGLGVSTMQRPGDDDNADTHDTGEPVMLVQQSESTNLVTARDTQCPASLDALCTSDKKFAIQMAAIPHTASTTTDKIFRAAWNISVGIEDRGFDCPPSKHIQIQAPSCRNQVGNASTDLFDCVLGNFRYRHKAHQTYSQISNKSQLVFTTLRDPAQFVLSQYNMKNTWDAQWAAEYPQYDLSDVDPAEWAANAWWRHNLFTKMLATDTKLIWTRPQLKVTPTKEESDRENALGEDSVWLQTALDQLKAMPFFGLMHRLTESFELMGFHLCFPVTVSARIAKKPRPVNAALEGVARRHFALDAILLQQAEKLFDALVLEMRQKKAQGFLCDLSNVLKGLDAEFGLRCL
jgi:hypothetical protein